jgi:LysR family cys regulon transcriptional activator
MFARMKLHRLRYLAAVARSGLDITVAAQKLHTFQPGVSEQIKRLEDELGSRICARAGATSRGSAPLLASAWPPVPAASMR